MGGAGERGGASRRRERAETTQRATYQRHFFFVIDVHAQVGQRLGRLPLDVVERGQEQVDEHLDPAFVGHQHLVLRRDGQVRQRVRRQPLHLRGARSW